MALDQPTLKSVVLRGGATGFRVATEWRYTWATPSAKYGLLERQIRIPEGFLHDGASIPRILWTPLGLTPAGLLSAAALVHDALYRYHGLLPHGWIFQRVLGSDAWAEILVEKRAYSREAADAMLRRIMLEGEVRLIQATLAYWGVRACGWHAWDHQRKLEVEEE